MRARMILLMAMGLGAIACSDGQDESLVDTSPDGAGGGPTIPRPENEANLAGDLDGQPFPPSGTLTAGDWDDNLNWEFFLDYRAAYLDAVAEAPTVAVEDRVVIQVTDSLGSPVPNALVEIRSTNQTGPIFTAPTGTDGRLLFFPSRDGDNIDASIIEVTPTGSGGALDTVSVAAPDSPDWTLVLPGAVAEKPLGLDIAFVVDTTGSMVDELAYLQKELESIATTARDTFSSLAIRFALVVYRDDDQEYVTRTFDFTSDVGTFANDLALQQATGGGDFPEAVFDAMKAMQGLSWRGTDENVARVAFLLADAAPHDADGENTLATAAALREQGIRLYSIAASGTDADAEYYLRQSAQLTLGRYLFLTGDSGIGSGHTDPHIPCYQVQYLADLIARMVASEVNGHRQPADASNVIREVGSPDENNVCTLSDGSEVSY